VLREIPQLLKRLRIWLGNIGYKVITGQPIGQHERTALVMYGRVKEGTPGYSRLANVERIPAVENNDVMINEAGALYMAATLPGPYLNHQKLISDTLLQRLTAYFGPHATDLKYCVGFYKQYGPYMDLELTPSDSIAWGTDDHLAGYTSRTSYLISNLAGLNPFAIRVPNMAINTGPFGAIGLYEDDPNFRITLTNQADIGDFEWDFNSTWRGMRINSNVHSGTMELALAEKALEGPAQGNTQVEHSTVEGMGIAAYTERAMAKINLNPNNRISENYLLPLARGVQLQNIDMTAYYARIGNVDALPAFSEFLEVPLKFFSTAVPRVVEYIASVTALPADERKRFEDVISLYHNCARYARMTKRNFETDLPINPETVARALLNL